MYVVTEGEAAAAAVFPPTAAPVGGAAAAGAASAAAPAAASTPPAAARADAGSPASPSVPRRPPSVQQGGPSASNAAPHPAAQRGSGWPAPALPSLAAEGVEDLDAVPEGAAPPPVQGGSERPRSSATADDAGPGDGEEVGGLAARITAGLPAEAQAGPMGGFVSRYSSGFSQRLAGSGFPQPVDAAFVRATAAPTQPAATPPAHAAAQEGSGCGAPATGAEQNAGGSDQGSGPGGNGRGWSPGSPPPQAQASSECPKPARRACNAVC